MGLVDFIGDFASVDAGLGMIPGPSSELIAEKVAAAFSANLAAALPNSLQTPRHESKIRTVWGDNNRLKTHCGHGHDFTPENTYVWRGRRDCRTCAREAKRRHKSRAAAVLKEQRRDASLRRLDAFTDLQRAYLAGLIDGEGCISATMTPPRGRSGPNCKVVLSIQMSTAEPLTSIAAWLAHDPPRTRKRLDPWRDIHVLAIHGKLMAAVLNACLPYLILKAEQARVAIAMQGLKAAEGGCRGPGHWLPDSLLIDLAEHTTRLHFLNRRGAEAGEVSS